GFLGSGKTILLQRLIIEAKEAGKKVAIVMNEFGSFDVDSQLLGEGISSKSLLNGCICCSLKDDMEVVLHNLYHSEKPDLVIIEEVHMPFIIGVIDGKRYIERDRYSNQTKHLIEE